MPQKFSACGGHIIKKSESVIFSRLRRAIIVFCQFEFYACLQGASRQAENSEFLPAAGAGERTLEVFTKGISLFFGACDALTHIHLYNVRNVYSKHTRSSSPQGRKLWATIRLYKGRSKVGFRVKKNIKMIETCWKKGHIREIQWFPALWKCWIRIPPPIRYKNFLRGYS